MATSVKAVITDERSQPAVRVTCALMNGASRAQTAVGTTDANGYVEFTGLSDGSYWVKPLVSKVTKVHYVETDSLAAPLNADYLVGTANATLSNEIVVGATPGGELGGTWASPTVDATHSGSAHHTRSHAITGTSDHTASSWSVPYSDGSGNVQEVGLSLPLTALVSTGTSATPQMQAVPVRKTWNRATGQTAAVASLIAYSVPSAGDGTYIITSNVLVTTSTTHSFTVTVSYTDEGGTARTLTLAYSQLSGTFITAITNVTGAGPYEGIPVVIRAQASSTITIATTGVFTTVTYNVEAQILQVIQS